MALHAAGNRTRGGLRSLVHMCVTLAFAMCCAVLLAPRDAHALNLKLNGVNYDFREKPDYDPNRCKAPSTVGRELRILRTVTPRVRIYAVSDCNIRPVLKHAKELNMTVWMGVWVGNTTKIFDKEFKTLTALVQEGLIERNLIAGINVGSESLYRNESTAAVLIANMNKVKELLAANNLGNIPISITDTLGELLKNPSVLDAVDVITFNSFPFWGKIPIEDAAKNLNESINELHQAVGNKSFVITETGWPTDGASKKASKASGANAAKYLNDFFLLADAQRWSYYYFSAFDTPYRKQVEQDMNTVEAYFGLFDANLKLDKAYETLVINGTTGADGPVDKLPKPTSSPLTAAPKSGSTAVFTSNVFAVVAGVMTMMLATEML